MWMNETWGPPIVDPRTGRTLRIADDDTRGHPSQPGNRKLSPQYAGGKRKSDTELEDGTPSKKRKLKKKHKKFTSPAGLRDTSEGQANDAEDHDEGDGGGTSRRPKKLVLLPPRPQEPDGRTCARCRKALPWEGMFLCRVCSRKAFCSEPCQQKSADGFCSLVCEAEEHSRDPYQSQAQRQEPDVRTCARCRKQLPREDVLLCRFCGRKAFCSESCKWESTEGFCSLACETEDHNYFCDPSQDSAQPSSEGLLSADELAQVSDPRNYHGMTNEGAAMEGIEGMSAEELEAQRIAMKGFEYQKEIADLKRQLQEHDDRTQAKADKFTIVDYESSADGRLLYYHLMDNITGDSITEAALNLHGSAWTEKLKHFWYDDEAMCRKRIHHEFPHGKDFLEPCSFGRHIVRADFADERTVLFEKRDFERRPGGSSDDNDTKYWDFATDLGPEWDEVIKDYWKRCKVRQEWDERSGRIEQLGLVPAGSGEVYMAKAAEGIEAIRERNSPRYSPPTTPELESSESEDGSGNDESGDKEEVKGRVEAIKRDSVGGERYQE